MSHSKKFHQPAGAAASRLFQAYQVVEVGQSAKLIKAKYKIKLNIFLKVDLQFHSCFRIITTLHIKIREKVNYKNFVHKILLGTLSFPAKIYNFFTGLKQMI